MKISIATGPWFPVPALQGGAMSRIWHGLAEEFAAHGHEVKVVCRSYPEQPSYEVKNGVEYIRFGGLPQSSNISFDLLKDFFYSLFLTPMLPKSDILIINDFWLPVFAALRPKTGKIVVNVNRFPKGQYWLYPKTNLFTVPSSAVKNALAEQCPSVIPKMKLIPNPIDNTFFSMSNKRNKLEAEKVILYVGRLHPEKGVHLLVDAFKLITNKTENIRLKIIGPYKETQGGGGYSYFKKLKIMTAGHKIKLAKPIFDIKNLAVEYRKADIFCYPSLAEKGESFGIAPLEAMATGLVPIVSNLQCFKDFVTANHNGFIFDHRHKYAAKELAKSINDSLIDTDKLKWMSKNAIDLAKKYSYSEIAKSYLSEF